MLVDSHCHLDFPDYAGELDAVVARAQRRRASAICVSIGTELARFPGVRAVAERFDNVWCSVGIHPHEAEKELLADPEPLLAETGHPKVVGIGETGLDYYYEHSPARRRRSPISAPISPRRATAGLPLIVHTRDADDDTIAMLEDEMGKGAFTGLIHCFTGTQRLADAALALGLYISVSGIATFKNSASLARCDQDRAAGPAAGGDRRAVPGAGAAPRQDQRARLCGAHRPDAGGAQGRRRSRDSPTPPPDNFFRLFTKAQRPA